MTIIIAFSINVASVIGNFKAVPKQAHWMDFLLNKVLLTPIVVIPNITSVIIKAILTSNRIKNMSPRAVSIKGYSHPYRGIRFAKGSYILKESGNPFKSNSLKKLNTI